MIELYQSFSNIDLKVEREEPNSSLLSSPSLFLVQEEAASSCSPSIQTTPFPLDSILSSALLFGLSELRERERERDVEKGSSFLEEQFHFGEDMTRERERERERSEREREGQRVVARDTSTSPRAEEH